MRVLVWTLGFWRDAAHAQRDADNWRGYRAWLERMQRCFKPVGAFVASGTWSDPKHSPIPEAITVNAGADWTKTYVGQRTHYGKMAFTSAMAYALNRVRDWDYLVMLDTDALIGALDIPKLLNEFAGRPETLIAPSWCHLIGGPLMIWKPEGAIRLLHHRPYVNYVDDNEPDMRTIWEEECLLIYRNLWWNPWPQFDCMLQEGAHPDSEAINWPALGRPSSEVFAQLYIEKHLKECVTL